MLQQAGVCRVTEMGCNPISVTPDSSSYEMGTVCALYAVLVPDLVETATTTRNTKPKSPARMV